MSDPRALEDAAWAAAYGQATPEQFTVLEADPVAWRWALEDLLEEIEDGLDSVRQLTGPERLQVVTDFESELGRLEAAYELLGKVGDSSSAVAAIAAADPIGETRLQASWHGGNIVVWAGGPDAPAANAEELAARLEAIGGPAVGWSHHQSVQLPGGGRAAALAIPVGESLGWLVAVGAGLGREGVGASVAWLGRVAVEATRLVARGAVLPTLPATKTQDPRTLELAVRWVPALVDEPMIERFTKAMPGPVTVLAPSKADSRTVAVDLLHAVVDAIVRVATARLELPAPPPSTTNTASVAEAVATRVDGSPFTAPTSVGAEISKRLDRWTRAVTNPARSSLVVQLQAPDAGNAWFLQVLGAGVEGGLLPVEAAIADHKSSKTIVDELVRLERIYDPLLRPGGIRRGQVYLSQDEAWEFMTVDGDKLSAAGFDVRVPSLSRRKPKAGLRLFTEPTGDSVVGAQQLSNVRWSVVFDDVELTADQIHRLAEEARPLVQSHGRWVELDKVDLKEAAAALAERAHQTQLTGAEILRQSVGLEGSPLAGGLQVEGSGWAADLLDKAATVSKEVPTTSPEGFDGELRAYQADALAWLGFLDSAELGGCLALDMGLGKTPTMLAHLGRSAGTGTALVIAPPAVVGNWANEARKFTPGLDVFVHHGAHRSSGMQLRSRIDRADVVITTYGTAVRDVEQLAEVTWSRLVLDEAQIIKNPTNETSQQLRRLPARSRIALTGTPVENGLGDLHAILDFCNPGLVGPRAPFIAQLSGEGEAALKALNGLLVFRRTKSEPDVAATLPDRIDELDHCLMTPEQIGLYQAVLDNLVAESSEAEAGGERRQGAILAAITALKQICNHPAAYKKDDTGPLSGRSGKLTRLEEIVDQVFDAGERVLIFTHFAEWGGRLAEHLTAVTGQPISCYHGGLSRGARDAMIEEFQALEGPGALVLSLKAGGTGLNLTSANHVVLYDRWWNPAVEDQARDRAWRIGQTKTVISHRLVCPGTVDERVEEVVAGKRHIADLVLPKSSSMADLDANQLRAALGLRTDELLTEEDV
jgi:hypothetical protein